MPGAGDLRERIAFDKRADADDGFGNAQGPWQEQFTVWAHVAYRRGSEPVIARRLVGVQPVAITVRATPQTRTISAEWRARNTRTGETYAIKSPPAESRDRAFLELMAETGTPA